MSRETRLYGDLRRLQVTDFSDHDDVGVLAQDSAQPARESHLDFGIDLRLTDAVNEILDRVLDGDDVTGVVIEAFKSRVQRGRLAGARGTGDEQNAVRLVDEFIHQPFSVGCHAKRSQVDAPGLFVEESQHDAFAMPGWDGRYAYIDRAPGDAQADAAILRQAFLGDVEL